MEREYRRRRVARRLLKQLTRLFIEREARIMLVDTGEAYRGALAFFRRSGFGREHRHIYLSQNLESHPKYLGRKNGERGRVRWVAA